MKALILAAGEGMRLRPLTSNIPKPLLMVAGRPFLTHSIEALKAAGVTEIYILTGFRGDRIRSHYRNGEKLGVTISYLEQKERRGTAHAIGMAETVMDESFFCLAGDVLVNGDDLIRMRELNEETGKSVVGATTVEDPSRFGVINVEEGMMKGLEEKPKKASSALVNASIYLLEPSVFRYIHETPLSPRNEYEITDSLVVMAKEEGVAVYTLQGKWIDVGQPWDLLDANTALMSYIKPHIEGVVEEGAYIRGNVVVEEGARIRSGSYIEGPVYISEGCDIGPNCYIRPSTALGPRCRVGNACEIKNSIVMADSKIPHQSYVGDSIIGERCNLGAGTKVANLRFDHQPVCITKKDLYINTGRKKMGVVMGDDVNTGVNAVILPGTVIYENAIINAGARASGLIGKGGRIF